MDRVVQPPVAILTGPTAAGKTAVAVELAAARKNVEIIN
ncbi:MAG TPA: tRNA (adenosine(37)-N6)-dimethylallyltransferase MiaA, partial [Bdellovibrionota bacterium]|nr:tRNA (adenosine(37)-N6)-dimethylallyltransferase MiaA [Bdellovibrionota bacterium]